MLVGVKTAPSLNMKKSTPVINTNVVSESYPKF